MVWLSDEWEKTDVNNVLKKQLDKSDFKWKKYIYNVVKCLDPKPIPITISDMLNIPIWLYIHSKKLIP